jgi:hypothetical protein
MFTQRQRLSRLSSLRKSRLASLRKSSVMPSGDDDKLLQIWGLVENLRSDNFSDQFIVKAKPEWLKEIAMTKAKTVKLLSSMKDKKSQAFKVGEGFLEMLERGFPEYIQQVIELMTEGEDFFDASEGEREILYGNIPALDDLRDFEDKYGSLAPIFVGSPYSK